MDWHDDKLSAASVCYITYEYKMPRNPQNIMVIVSRFLLLHSSDNLSGNARKDEHQVKRDRKALIFQHTRKL